MSNQALQLSIRTGRLDLKVKIGTSKRKRIIYFFNSKLFTAVLFCKYRNCSNNIKRYWRGFSASLNFLAMADILFFVKNSWYCNFYQVHGRGQGPKSTHPLSYQLIPLLTNSSLTLNNSSPTLNNLSPSQPPSRGSDQFPQRKHINVYFRASNMINRLCAWFRGKMIKLSYIGKSGWIDSE